jgi:stage II sporulation protein D
MHRLALVLACVLLAPVGAGRAQAAEAETPETVAGQSVELSVAGGVRLEVDGVRFKGPLEVVSTSGGLGLIERTTLDGYLEGIAEVPFGWEMEALRSQAVAARTYLAWTLERGRTSTGRRYGYDICATTQCQVYAGVGVVEGWGGDRWRTAVESTSDEILVSEGEPAQALYSSTSGGRTRNVEDVFPGASPTPYLVAVESPNEESPFVDWSFSLDYGEMRTLMGEAGLVAGELGLVSTEVTEDGGGPWMVEIDGTEGLTRISTWELRTRLNAAAAALPDVLPVMRPDVDRPYPQTILSPTFTIETEIGYYPTAFGAPRIVVRYVFAGHGWGHLVGMSQYGAQALATAGASYGEILAHYYGGLRPEVYPGLPDEVVVGLEAGADEFEVGADGPLTVTLDGEVIAVGVLGTWGFERAGDGVRVTPPVGLGLPPGISDIGLLGPAYAPVALEAWSTTAAEVRVVERNGDRLIPRSGWQLVDAGPVRWTWTDVAPITSAVGGVLVVEARSPLGMAEASLAFVPGAE